MPRAKVDPALRKRVARACDLCRKRKEKCTGGDPCPQCRERGTEDQCQYTPVHKTPYSPRPGQEASVVDEVSSNEGSPAAFKQRQRVVIACDACRKRKERCDGQKPCGQCRLRGTSAACSYTPITPSQAQRAARPNANILLRGQNENASSNANQADDQAAGPSHVPEAQPAPRASSGPFGPLESVRGTPRVTKSVDAGLSSAPVPKLSRMLKDGKGSFVYVGDSSSASFLQSVRRHVAASLGPCKFTTDDSRHILFEELAPNVSNLPEEPNPRSINTMGLDECYCESVSGILDLFDRSWLYEQLLGWTQDSTRRANPQSPVIYLAVAIALQGRRQNENDDKFAEQYFAFGRKLALANLMDSPSLLTIQAFTLISYYMLAAHRRNAAYVNLGVAVRAAYALGIHRHEANAASPEDGLYRERTWKSLRALDLFMSASMGRPPATSEPDCNIPWASLEVSADRESSTVPAQASSAIFRICDIIERVLTEVYSKRSVSLELAGNISAKHREWTANLPKMLEIDGLSEAPQGMLNHPSRKIGSNIVTMAYYYSIILLARSFLEYAISAPQDTRAKSNSIVQSANIKTYADACVDSALKAISVAKDMDTGELPKRQPVIINTVFISALCVGLAFFGDYDQKGWPLGRSLDTAITILQRFGRANPQSAKYADICALLEDATKAYVKRRDESWLQSSSRHVRNVFGDLQTTDSPQPSPSQNHALLQHPSGQPALLSQLVDAANAAPQAQTPNRAPAAYMGSTTGEHNTMMQSAVMAGTSGHAANGHSHPDSYSLDSASAGSFATQMKTSGSFSFGD